MAGQLSGEGDFHSAALSGAGFAVVLWVIAWLMARLIPGKHFEFSKKPTSPWLTTATLAGGVAAFAALWFVFGYAGAENDRVASGLRMARKGAVGCAIGIVPGLLLLSRFQGRIHPVLAAAGFTGLAFIGLALGGANSSPFAQDYWITHGIGVLEEGVNGASLGALLGWHQVRKDAQALMPQS